MNEFLAALPRKKTSKRIRLLSRMVFLILGSVFVSVALEIFLVNNNIIDGGITGAPLSLSAISMT